MFLKIAIIIEILVKNLLFSYPVLLEDIFWLVTNMSSI